MGQARRACPKRKGLEGTETKPIRFASTGALLLLLGITGPIYAQQQDKDRQDKQQHKQEQQRAQQKQQAQRVQQGQEQAVWQQHRASSWQSQHQTWQQRGGYSGYRISDDNFRGYFGPRITGSASTTCRWQWLAVIPASSTAAFGSVSLTCGPNTGPTTDHRSTPVVRRRRRLLLTILLLYRR